MNRFADTAIYLNAGFGLFFMYFPYLPLHTCHVTFLEAYSGFRIALHNRLTTSHTISGNLFTALKDSKKALYYMGQRFLTYVRYICNPNDN